MDCFRVFGTFRGSCSFHSTTKYTDYTKKVYRNTEKKSRAGCDSAFPFQQTSTPDFRNSLSLSLFIIRAIGGVNDYIKTRRAPLRLPGRRDFSGW